MEASAISDELQRQALELGTEPDTRAIAANLRAAHEREFKALEDSTAAEIRRRQASVQQRVAARKSQREKALAARGAAPAEVAASMAAIDREGAKELAEAKAKGFASVQQMQRAANAFNVCLHAWAYRDGHCTALHCTAALSTRHACLMQLLLFFPAAMASTLRST
jgi:hypothetical protein